MQTARCLTLALALALVGGLLACKKKDTEPPKPNTQGSSSTAQTSAPAQPSPNDEMTAHLRKVAGASAKDCGTVPGKGGDVESASACALQSNDAQQPFWVRYELPLPTAQMSIATARGADGKLYTVQYSSDGYKEAPKGTTLSDDKKLLTVACPDAPLRLASSGRVTCFAPQQNAGGVNPSPHGGGMAMPPGASPHGTMPPATGQNPHATNPPPSTTKSH